MKPILGASFARGLLMLGLLLPGLVMLAGSTAAVSAQPMRWRPFSIPQTGMSVDIPAVFSETAGRPAVYGEKFKTADGRASLTVESGPNTHHDSPASFLAKQDPPPHIRYKRVTPRFFAVSSYKGDDVWYNRCNISARFVNCVLINYPRAAEHDWDDIVTHISLSLKGD